MPGKCKFGEIAAVILLMSCESGEVTNPITTEPEPFLADIDTRIVTSEISRRNYQISVALPQGYSDSTETYPVLYAVDANGQFGTVVETVRNLNFNKDFQPILVVGIGYPVGGRQVLADGPRSVDLLPTQDTDWEQIFADAGIFAPEGSGGAGDFLRFIREELIARIESEYRVNPSNRGFYGHSFGGLFGLFALFQDAETFDRLIVGSPSLWWDDRYMFRLEKEFSEKHSSLSARVFMSVGCDENDELHVDSGGWGRMVTNFREFVDAIERHNYDDFVWHHMCFENENHGSVIPATISRGLRYIYEAP